MAATRLLYLNKVYLRSFTARIVDVCEGSQAALDQTAFDVRSTDEVGRVRVVKTESKGKGNKRVRLEVIDSSP